MRSLAPGSGPRAGWSWRGDESLSAPRRSRFDIENIRDIENKEKNK